MRARASTKDRGGFLSLVICLALLVGACAFAWTVFGGAIDKMFTALAHAVSRAG